MGQNKEQLHIRTFPNRHTHTITHPNISQQAYTHNYTSEHPPTGIHTNLHIRTSPNRHSYTHNYTSEHPPTGIHTQLHIRTFRAPRCVHWMSTSALSEVLPRIRDRATLSLENAPVSFAACPVCSFPTYNLHSTTENNGQ